MGNLGNTDNIDVIAALKKAEKMRIEFVANVSHELRTPLTSIKGYAETLLQDMEDGRSADPEFLKIILKNSNRLLALINDLLDLSAIESGADELHPATLDLHEMTQHALHALQLNAENKHSTILTEVHTPNVYADPKRVEQVITNLVDNAIKYCPTGSTVTVKWTLEQDELGEAVFLRVIDNGPGIAEKYLDRLFERFYRLDKGRSRESGGTGLGLSIVKHVMQRHDGSVTVESTLGTGTTFICRFPLRAAP
jgi:two-component system phosphate regulon sensor histidine kinase PhoR